MKSICFIAHDAYGAMCGGAFGHVGGVERQTSLMSKWFAARGYRVSVLTWDEGQPDDCCIDGVRVIKVCARQAGLPGLRFVHPRWTGLNRALRLADADLYYHNSAEYVTGQVAAWCRWRGRRFVYSVASDPACDASLPTLQTVRERTLYRHGLRAADLILVQTKKQQRMLRESFGRVARVMPMPCPGPTDLEPPDASDCGPDVLWVGRFVELKRLELLLDVAAALPEVRFHIAGDGDSSYARALAGRLAASANVAWHGRVTRETMPELYRRAACLCCTSAYEGFPNTFLEAWAHGVPVVSTLDPDDLIDRLGLGAVANDASGLATAIRDLMSSGARRRIASENARRYYLAHHAPETALGGFERAFLELFDETNTEPVPALVLNEA